MCLTLCDPTDYTVHGILQARILERVAVPFSRGSFQPRDRTQVSRIAGGFFTVESQGKPKNTGVGSLSLLQQIFLTQECNQGLLHHRRILYQLSYQGNHGEQTKTRKTQNFCFLRLQILLKANTVCLNLKYLLIINNLRKSLKSF